MSFAGIGWFTEDIWVELGNAPPHMSSGDFCLTAYTDGHGNTYYGVSGVVVAVRTGTSNPYECIPVNYALTDVLLGIQTGLHTMANWLIISANELQTKLNLQTSSIVAQVGSSGGGGGGFTDVDRSMLNQINAKILEIDTNTRFINEDLAFYMSRTESQINNLSTNMIIDHDEIFQSIEAGLGVSEDGLLSGIGDLLSAGWEWVEGLIAEFANQIGEVLDFGNTMVGKVEGAFKLRMSEIVDSMIAGMAFMSSEIAAAFDSIVESILAPLSLLGDIKDFLALDFMDWLTDTFTLDISEVEEFTRQFMDMLTNLSITVLEGKPTI